ncbi:hypothetical protein ACFFKH_20340 [Micromonospora marina]|uniref:Uncharacterized protein n=1 Tax=Micromonospora marina TaxID=307120 RepID=A0A1C4X1K5_9ACTN|nr:hypothetical protein [Micromonospora marina]SCF02329.1 hypothetical protein GA0070215_10675 [Micromonospora marina]
MRALGTNAIVHDPAAAPVVGGRVVAAAEAERFSRRTPGGRPVPRRGGLGLDRIMREKTCGSR